VNNEAQFKSVLIHSTIGYIFRNRKVPADIATDLEYLKRLAKDRTEFEKATADGSSNDHWNRMQGHIAAVSNSGGHMQLTATVMYRAWRLGWHSREIANEMGMTERAVVDILIKLARIADVLGYPTYPRRNDRQKNVRAVDDIIELWNAGETVDRIASQLRCTPVLVRRVLKKRGLYVWRRQKRRKTGPNPKLKALAEMRFIKTVAWG